jgi:hypothetical protein
MRIQGGSSKLIQSLEQRHLPNSISTKLLIQRILVPEDRYVPLTLIGPNDQKIAARRLIIARPPKNILAHIYIHQQANEQNNSALDSQWQHKASSIATWMGHTGKLPVLV